MGKKGHKKEHGKKKLTKKEKKAMNHLKLIQGKKGQDVPGENYHQDQDQYKKAS